MSEIIIFVLGFGAGMALIYFLLRQSLDTRYQGLFEEWKANETRLIRSDANTRSRATLKGKIGEQLAPLLPEFDYVLSDARFLGSPIDYVVFDGYAQVMAREARELKRIVFVEVKKGAGARLSYEERR